MFSIQLLPLEPEELSDPANPTRCEVTGLCKETATLALSEPDEASTVFFAVCALHNAQQYASVLGLLPNTFASAARGYAK